MTRPIVERAAVAKVWPRQVADTTAEYLTPRQIEMLYASANWAHEAADTIEELVEAIERISEHETDAPCRTAEEANSRCIGEMKRIALQTLSKIGSERP
jgi:hypothetical protein